MGGRPREGSHAKTAPISIRTDPHLRAGVEAYRLPRGLSMTQAVERLLLRGLDAEGGIEGASVST
jgi:hypothetical protein